MVVGFEVQMNATRQASFDTLYNKSADLLDKMLMHGVTAVEAKSGMGLNWETEKKNNWKLQKSSNNEHAIDIVSTFMGAHAIPAEYQGRSNEFIDLIIDEMLPKVKAEKTSRIL